MSEITPNTPNPVREDAYKQQLAAKLGIDPKYIPGSPIWHSEEEIAAIAEMFSNMAGSSGGGVLVVDADSNGVLNKTYKEIADAVVSIMRSKIDDKSYDFYWLSGFGYDEYSGYYVKYDDATFLTDSENGYPSAGGGGGPQ